MFGGRKFIVCMVFLTACGSKSVSSPKEQEAPTNSTPPDKSIVDQEEENMIQEFWEGRVFSRRSVVEEENSKPIAQLIIRNEKELDAFVSRIPKKRIQKRNPAPDSDDPFLAGVQIDFQKSVLLVSIRDENMYAKAPIVRVYESNGRVTAKIQVPQDRESAMMASMGGVGTYYAVRIPLITEEIVFEVEQDSSADK